MENGLIIFSHSLSYPQSRDAIANKNDFSFSWKSTNSQSVIPSQKRTISSPFIHTLQKINLFYSISVMIMCAAFRNILDYLKSWCRKPSHFRWFTRSIKMSRVASILFLYLWSMYINILHVIFSVEDMDAYKQAVPILLPIAQIGMTGTSNKFKSFSLKKYFVYLAKDFLLWQCPFLVHIFVICE